MERRSIDINCDVGEGVENENDLFPYITSCNIACGGHAGDRDSMRYVIRLAKKYGIKIGAHPSYPDKKNFGRISVDLHEKKLIKSISDQMKVFTAILTEERQPLHHIKPHGALYNDITKDRKLAGFFLESIEKYKSDSILYAPYGSSVEKEALKRGFKITYEAFGDRNYSENLTLVPRSMPNALITEPEEVLQHILTMMNKKQVRTASGKMVKILADTYCIHGDTPLALQILMYLNRELPKHHIYLNK